MLETLTASCRRRSWPTRAWLAGLVLALCALPTSMAFADPPAAAAPLTLYVVRHGQTDWNLAGRIQGNTDNPLNATGQRQAQDISRQLAHVPIDHIYPSGLKRAIETAEAFAGRAPITPLPALNERSRGIYEGKIAAEVNDEFRPRFQAPDDDMDGGESLNAIAARVGAATREILKKHMGDSVMVVGHSGVNPLVVGELIGLAPERAIAEIRQGNDEVYKLRVYPDGATEIWKLIPPDRLDQL